MRARIAIVGIGNRLAGDDGAGIEVVERLRALIPGKVQEEDVLLHALEGDVFAVSDLLPRAGHFIFADATPGDPAGRVVSLGEAGGTFAPSLHQADIGSVMRCLRSVGAADPFPSWEIWGVTIAPPHELREGLSPEVEEGVRELADLLLHRVKRTGVEGAAL